MDELKQKWQSLNQREQWIVKIAAVFIGILLIYYLIVAPLSDATSTVQAELAYQRDLLSWIEPRVNALQGQAASGQSATQNITQAELLPTIDSRLKNTEFANTVEQVTQTNTNDVRITFKDVPFDALMDWLETQWKTSRITVDTIDVQKGDKLGLTNINLTLRLG
jgi:type II secretory pathway component PulM